MKNDTVCKEKASNVFLKEREQYFENAQLQDKNIAISELKKLIDKFKGKPMETMFDKPSVVRQPNAQRIPKPSVLGKPTPFSDSLERKSFLKTKSVLKTNVSEGVIHRTSVSIPQLRSTQMKYKVVPNNSQVKFKKTKVEDHHMISSISNKTKSVTAYNDSLKSRTSNVNVVYATCGKCMFNSNHDACVSKFIHDVNARTKKPKVVPISTRTPKSQANKSVATPLKKTVASESTIQKSKSYYRMLYEKTSKARKWWIAQQCPSGYKWVPKTKMKWVPKVRKEDIVQLILFIVDSGCTKHMTGNLKLLCNFVEKYLGTVRFGNDQFALILGYEDLGNYLLTGNRDSDLYTISLQETTSSTPICFMAKASPTQSWLWHRKLSHLNFDYINLLSKKNIVIGLPKLKYVKDQLCSSCEASKAKRSSFKTKDVPSSKGRLHLLHMDLCGHMRVASINGKKYILHDCTAMSSTEAEYVALSTSYAQVENGIIELYFVKTEYQLADMFTKALPKDRFQYLVRRIGMRCLTPAELEVLANESS
ncbi:retrovirus-related pol polyprotein from transposon TNT 1-94 [Tanacetum coccineum]|uniref:Retrovirus-related pol polyprotein from transposon TNT 1-94 n=1 Tax=Tanacetum coccineum TaxID=301880 RepID=A0ABQ4ZLA3_9ASTR